MTDIVAISKKGAKVFPQTHATAVIGLSGAILATMRATNPVVIGDDGVSYTLHLKIFDSTSGTADFYLTPVESEVEQ